MYSCNENLFHCFMFNCITSSQLTWIVIFHNMLEQQHYRSMYVLITYYAEMSKSTAWHSASFNDECY